MKRFVFIAGAVIKGRTQEQRVEVEADSEPEAIYDAKKGVFEWLRAVVGTTADLKRFDLVSVQPA